MNSSDPSPPRLDRADVDRLVAKLSHFAEGLDPPERRALAGLIELAGKMYEGTRAPAAATGASAATAAATSSAPGAAKAVAVAPAVLPLKREVLRELNVWNRLLETQGHSLWTCDRPIKPGEEVINPL